jgi:hypothetical protein
MDALILARMQFAANITFHICDDQHRAGTLLFFRTGAGWPRRTRPG